jgi:predicted Zn-dependent protease
MRFVSVLLGFLLLCTPAHARFQPKPCKNSYTTDQEITEGKKAAAQIYKQMPVLPDSSPVTRYIQQLGNKLVQYAPGYRWPYQFHVVDMADINAFALPGGAIFVNLGTIQAAENEAQLAGVIAHEISHVVLRHATCNLTKQACLPVSGKLPPVFCWGAGPEHWRRRALAQSPA